MMQLYDIKDVTIALIKHAGLHEGKWTISVSLMSNATNVPMQHLDGTPVHLPGYQVAVNQIGLAEASHLSPPSLIVDAAVVNPKRSHNKVKERT